MAIAELTTEGLKIPAGQETLIDLQTIFKTVFGSDFDISINSVGGILISIIAEREAMIFELINSVFFSAYPDHAESMSLDNASSYTAISRFNAQKSRVLQMKLITTSLSPVFIPANTKFKQSTTNVQFQTILDTTIPANSFVVIEVESVETGAFSASVGSIDTIVSIINGLDSVTNLTEALVGRNIETDAELRRRREASLVVSKGGVIDAIINRIQNEVQNITYVSGIENDTNVVVNGLGPHSILITAMGGTDNDIAQKINDTKAGGIGTNGSTSVTIIDANGNNKIIRFNRITSLSIYLIVNVTKDSTYLAGSSTTIKNLLVDYGNTFVNGQDVINWRLLGILEPVLGIIDLEILQGIAPTPTLSNNISVNNNQKATFSIANILVNEI